MKNRILSALLAAAVLTSAPFLQARPLGIWSKSVKMTLGPKGRDAKLADRKVVAIDPGVVMRPEPETCYDYAFISRRNGGVDNIFFANSCTPFPTAVTPNTSSRILYSGLSASPTFDSVAAIEIDVTDPMRPHPYLTTWNRGRGGQLPYYSLRDRMIPSYPAWGPYDWFAMVTTNAEWMDAVVRSTDNFSTSGATEPAVVLPDDPNDTRTLGRLSWIPVRDASQPGYHKLIVSVRRGGFYDGPRWVHDDVDRLFVLDPSTGDLQPLRDASDFSASREDAIEGKEPSVSADGRKLAFIRNVYGLNRLWTCDLNLASAEEGGPACINAAMVNTEIREPESRVGNYDWPCWSYDSRKIFLSFDGYRASTDNHPYSKILMMNPDGSRVVRLGDANADGTDNTDNDTYPACLPLMLHAVTQERTATVVPAQQQQYQAVPATTTYQPAPFRCDETHACPTGMTCGSDNTCH